MTEAVSTKKSLRIQKYLDTCDRRKVLNRFNKQNKNSERASRVFVHFFAVTARLRRENWPNFTFHG